MSNWIKNAIKHPGSLTAKAKSAGAMTDRGTISAAWLAKKKKSKGKIGYQARLAETLKKMRHK